MKQPGYSAKGKQSTNIVLDYDGETYFDPKKVANCFNNFFTTIASNLVENYLLPSICSIQIHLLFKSFIFKNVQLDQFSLTPVTEDFIYKELCRLNPSKSTGTGHIPARFVKDAASVLTKPITHIVNVSIENNSVPCELKTARVVPFFKKNKRCEVSNYRPVSVLSVVSKFWKNLSIFSLRNTWLIRIFCLIFNLDLGADTQQTHA